LLGTAIALGGVFILSGGEYVAGEETFVGDLVCFGSMILFTWYLALARSNRDFPSLWLYLVPLYGLGAVFCFATSAVKGELLMVFSAWDYLMLIALGIIPTVFGHSLLNRAMTHLRGQVVSVFNVGQFITAGVMAYLFFGEQPTTVFYLAAGLILIGATITVRADPRAAVVRASGRG
jgi:drug/metabolite transporter (DMT)-like permease